MNVLILLSLFWQHCTQKKIEELNINSMEATRMEGLAPSPQSEAVTSELQELSIHPAPDPVPLQERKNGEIARHSDVWIS